MPVREALLEARPVQVSGSVARVTGHEVEVRGLRLRVGDSLAVEGPDGRLAAEVVAIGPEGATCLLFGRTTGLGRGDRALLGRSGAQTLMSEALVGRVVDALGDPIDGGPPIGGEPTSIVISTPSPMARRRVTEQLSVGVKVIDTLVAVGSGQRVGIFGGSGVGKSTLLGMMARGTTADVNVVALVGERGREVREFIEDGLGAEGMSRAVVVVATSDEPALMRLRAGLLATRIAEWFADRGREVLLTLDSLTRLAMAQREIGLAAGEPPTARGYTPSVFALLPALLERAGPRVHGNVTGLYTVLVEGDDFNDPIADTARAILDGHIVLDRRLTLEGRFPAVDPLSSLSRLADRLVTPDDRRLATAVRSTLAAAEGVRELVEVGAYVPGTNPLADLGMAATPELIAFFGQAPEEQVPAGESWRRLAEIAGRLGLT